jgi:hypothetical protein
MSEKAAFTLKGRNPDILTCIANLSNDEVFTPPEFANRMLEKVAEAWAADHGGANIWADHTVRFLDPCTKSGVYLREITRRLTEGLTEEIPDLQERVDHILTKQVFGIAITRLTAMLARRSVYCSKHAQGNHSIGQTFANDDGNIWWERMEHSWVDDKCKYCGAAKTVFNKGGGAETHSYAFIHTDDIQARVAELFGDNMQFDVIIGNPPYQLDDGGFGTSAVPIYQKFVEQAKALEPNYLTMVIPARWFAGGKGLDEFRASMLADDRLRVIEDFPDSNDVFPGTQIKGGICYFLWEKQSPGLCQVVTWDRGVRNEPVMRPLLENGSDIFIRYNESLPILRKVIAAESGFPPDSDLQIALPAEKKFAGLVSSAKPFGLRTFFQGNTEQRTGSVRVYQNGGVAFVDRDEVTKNQDLIDQWKVFIPRAGSGSDAFPHSILGRPFVGEPGTVSTETYNCIGPFESEKEARNAISYISTKLFRFLVLLHKPTQDANRGVYTFVPKQDFSVCWTDASLFKRYGVTEDEQAFIAKMIRPMDVPTSDAAQGDSSEDE